MNKFEQVWKKLARKEQMTLDDKWDFFEGFAREFLAMKEWREWFQKVFPDKNGAELFKCIVILLVFKRMIIVYNEKEESFRLKVNG